MVLLKWLYFAKTYYFQCCRNGFIAGTFEVQFIFIEKASVMKIILLIQILEVWSFCGHAQS